MALHTRPGVLPAILKPKAAPAPVLDQEEWEDKLAKIIAVRRARQEMRSWPAGNRCILARRTVAIVDDGSWPNTTPLEQAM